MDSLGTEPEGDDELIWQDEVSYDLAGNRTQKAHTERLGNGDLELTLRHYKYNQANQLILEWKEEGTLTAGTVAGEVWDEESGLAKLTLNGVTPPLWGDYFYGQAPPSNGMVFLLAEDHVKNQTLIGVNVTTGLSDFVGYSYDENGNLVERLSEEGPVQYQWDHRNRLTKVTHPDGQETCYEYCGACPLGKLSKMTRADGSTVEWVWDGISFLREEDSQDAFPMEYFGGLSVKKEGSWYYLHADVMGTVWQVTDERGAVVNDFQWDAWGNELTGSLTDGSSVCQIGWQGKRFDEEQGVFYSMARWYDQRLGRFTQPDPADGVGVVSTGGEGYGWPGRHPVSLGDPDGCDTSSLGWAPGIPNAEEIFSEATGVLGFHDGFGLKPEYSTDFPLGLEKAYAWTRMESGLYFVRLSPEFFGKEYRKGKAVITDKCERAAILLHECGHAFGSMEEDEACQLMACWIMKEAPKRGCGHLRERYPNGWMCPGDSGKDFSEECCDKFYKRKTKYGLKSLKSLSQWCIRVR